MRRNALSGRTPQIICMIQSQSAQVEQSPISLKSTRPRNETLNLLSMFLDTLLRLGIILHTLLGPLDSSGNIEISLFLGNSTEDDVHVLE